MHKKIQYILLLMLFTCLIPVTAKNKSRISLNDEWQFKLWWILPVALLFIPVNGTVENVITIVLNVVFLGCSYAKMYAKLEGKQESETQAIGCVSGLIPIIAVVKFLSYKGNN